MLYGSPRLMCAAFIMITLHEPCRAAGAKPSINQLLSTESTDTAGESAAKAKSGKPKSEL